MSSDKCPNAVDPDSGFKTRVKQLAVDSMVILRDFDRMAAVVAIVAFLVIAIPLDIGPLWALGLAGMTYVGTALLRPHQVPISIEPMPSIDEDAYALSRDSSARMLILVKECPDPATRRRVRAVQGKFTKMLDVMDEDQKFKSTNDYYTVLIRPFERLLSEYVRLSSRAVPLAGPQLRYFERDIVPRTEAVAEAFYQDYHQTDVIDLAALMEIHRLNLDSLSPDDDALDLDESEEQRDDDSDEVGGDDNR